MLSELDPNKSNVNADIPAKLLKLFSRHFVKPVTDLLNSAIKQGRWPAIFKMEIVTPVPKKFPPKDVDQKYKWLVKSRLIISDMKVSMDPSEFANQKGLSTVYSTLSDQIYR